MKKKIYTVGNMVDIPDISSVSNHNNDNTIIFVGKMSYDPNIVAVSNFALNIFPELKKQFPDIKFIIVGAKPDPSVLRLTNINGVEVTGFVESIEPYFQNATIVIAPMLTGAGIQNKIIQAMSYGCCVATTTIGAEGLTINNDEILVIDTITDWINRISYLLKNKNLRIEMGSKARNYVIKNLSKDVVFSQFDAFINAPFLTTESE